MPPTSRGFVLRFFLHPHCHHQLAYSKCSSPRLQVVSVTSSITSRSYAIPTGNNIRDTIRRTQPQKPKTLPIESRRPVQRIEEELSQSSPESSKQYRPEAEAQSHPDAETVQARRYLIPPHVRKFLGWVFLVVPILAFGVTHFPFGVMTVTGGSMRPVFNAAKESDGAGNGDDLEKSRDKVLVLLQGHWKQDDILRGEIVVFRAPHDPTKIAVKRVVALAGDRVIPLEGFDLTEDERRKGVLVPFNYMWVEGDVDDRGKSLDSNWYGPISQNLVIGRAKVLLTPWYRPTWIRAREHNWPAEEKQRVKYNAVPSESRNVDHRAAPNDFLPGGPASMALADFRSDPQLAAEKAQHDWNREKMVNIYQQARDEYRKQNPATKELAGNLIAEIEKTFYRAGGSIEHPIFPELKYEVLAESVKLREEHERKLAAAQLEAYNRAAKEKREARTETG